MSITSHDLTLLNQAQELGQKLHAFGVRNPDSVPRVQAAIQQEMFQGIFRQSFAGKNMNPEQSWGDTTRAVQRKRDVLGVDDPSVADALFGTEGDDAQNATAVQKEFNPLKNYVEGKAQEAMGLQEVLLQQSMDYSVMAGVLLGLADQFNALAAKPNDKDITRELQHMQPDPELEDVMGGMAQDIQDLIYGFMFNFARAEEDAPSLGIDALGQLHPSPVGVSLTQTQDRTH